jgi:hypothetical protein
VPRAHSGSSAKKIAVNGAKKVAVNGGFKLTVFEIFFADGLEAGPSAKREVFSREVCAESPSQRPSAKIFFFIF